MPSTMPGISITRGAEAAAGHRPDHQAVSRGGPRPRKAGRAETSTDPAPLSMLETVITLKPTVRVAEGGDLVLRVGAGVAEADPAARHAGPVSPGGAGRPDERGAEDPGVSNAWTMPIKGADRHAHHRHPDAGGAQDLRGRPEGRSRRSGRRSRRSCRRCRGRAASSPSGRAAVLPRLRMEPRRAGPLRTERRRGAGGRPERHRRRERDDDRRGAGALSGQRPLHARLPAATSSALGRVLVPVVGRAAADPARQLATSSAATGPSMIRNEDGLLTGYVYVDLAGRDPAGYVKRRTAAPARKAEAAGRLRPLLERPVRGHAARQGAADGGRSRDALPDLPAALHEHAVGDEDGHRRCWRFPSRRSAPSGSSSCSATT